MTSEEHPLRLLPDLGNLSYCYAVPPTGAQLQCWATLRECERRLEFCRWIRREITKDTGPNHRPWIEDSASAFYLTLEAAIQALKKQWKRDPARGNFDDWFKAHPNYTLVLKGLRTLRHLHAHVDAQEGKGETVIPIGGLDHGKGERRHWLPAITPEKLDSLERPTIDASEIPQWDAAYSRRPMHEVFEEALEDLVAIVHDAEASFSW